MNPIIRPAQTADLPALLPRYAQLTGGTVPPNPTRATQVFQQIQDNPLLTIFVLTIDNTPVATCMLAVTPCLTHDARPFATIENVVTDAAHRQRGYGRAVLDAAVAAAWDAHCYKVMLATGSSRPETLRFYQTAGFTRGKTAFQKRAITFFAHPH